MKRDHKHFFKAVIVFSILFWGGFFVAFHLIPWISYHYLSTPSAGFIEMINRTPQLDESKL